ncbi:MAG: N,N-dimethylformamidase beta subunit family domain-containing protein [Actinomycetes bacterium]
MSRQRGARRCGLGRDMLRRTRGLTGSRAAVGVVLVVVLGTVGAAGTVGVPVASATGGPVLSRLGGVDRYATAAVIAVAGFPGGASTVILATGVDYPDALGATYLAGVIHAPILLSTPDRLPASAARALVALKATAVDVVGGRAAVGSSVTGALRAAGYQVRRIAGADRYATNAAVIAAAGRAAGTVSLRGVSAPTAIVATGEGFPDALGAGAESVAWGLPVVLTPGSDARVPASVLGTLAVTGARQVLVVGGVGAVSPGQAAGLAGAGYAVTRVAGADRAGTSVALARLGAGWSMSGTSVLLASGTDYPDALAGAVLAGLGHRVLLVTDSSRVPGATAGVLGAAGEVTALGGTSVLPDWLATGQGSPPVPVPAFTPDPGFAPSRAAVEASQASGRLAGWLDASAVTPGGRVGLHLAARTAGPVIVRVGRVGAYGRADIGLTGLIGRTVVHTQPDCSLAMPAGTWTCPWPVSLTLRIPATWPAGLYQVLATAADGAVSINPLVVTRSGPVSVVVVIPTLTDQAYNSYPLAGGKSLYAFNSTGLVTAGGTRAAVTVSFNRPYDPARYAHMRSGVWPLARWLDAHHVTADYTTDAALGTPGSPITPTTRLVIVAGHAEYETRANVAGLLAARDAGVSLGFLGGNDISWQVRLGTGGRTVTCWRSPRLDPVADRALTTTMWTNTPLSWDPQQLLGASYAGILNGHGPWTVGNASSWLYAGTGLRDGDRLAGLFAGEVDAKKTGRQGPPGSSWLIVGTGTVARRGRPGVVTGTATIYQAPSGAWVFDAATLDWIPQINHQDPTGRAVAAMTQNLVTHSLR